MICRFFVGQILPSFNSLIDSSQFLPSLRQKLPYSNLGNIRTRQIFGFALFSKIFRHISQHFEEKIYLIISDFKQNIYPSLHCLKAVWRAKSYLQLRNNLTCSKIKLTSLNCTVECFKERRIQIQDQQRLWRLDWSQLGPRLQISDTLHKPATVHLSLFGTIKRSLNTHYKFICHKPKVKLSKVNSNDHDKTISCRFFRFPFEVRQP